jgi:two-component sensor histidine kinase
MWGGNRAFAMPDGASCALPPPLPYSEAEGSPYRLEAEEVLAVREGLTDDQRAVARFWSDDPMLSPTPPGHWISIADQVLAGAEAERRLEVMALLGIALADAFIACWQDKFEHNTVRPVTYIRAQTRDRVRAAFTATRAIIGAFEIDFRIMIGNELKWISARGQGDDAGIVQRIMFGIFIDVTGRKQAEEGRELLAGEMSHRVKNLLAIASGLTAITSRSTSTTGDMARELTLRLTALGRAHDLVRPVPGQTEAGSALLGDLLTVLLAPYDDLGAFSGRIRVSVPRMSVGESATRSLHSSCMNWLPIP